VKQGKTAGQIAQGGELIDMPSEVREVLEAMPSAFLPEKAGSARALFQLNMTGDDGGQWVMEIADGLCHVREEVATRQPDVTLSHYPEMNWMPYGPSCLARSRCLET
jgi:hypothetical protein